MVIQPTIRRAKVTVTTDTSGNAAVVSGIINGEIVKVAYDRGTVDSATTCVITTDTAEQIDSYNVNTAAAANRYPMAAVTGAAAGDNKWTPFIVDSVLTFTVTSGAHSKTFYVYIFYR